MKGDFVLDWVIPGGIVVAVAAIGLFVISIHVWTEETMRGNPRELVRICADGTHIWRDPNNGDLYGTWAKFARDIPLDQVCAK